MKIAIAGTGYVGLSNAMIFAQHHQVMAYDLQAEKIKLLNQRISPIRDQEISEFLTKSELNFQATPLQNRCLSTCRFCDYCHPYRL